MRRQSQARESRHSSALRPAHGGCWGFCVASWPSTGSDGDTGRTRRPAGSAGAAAAAAVAAAAVSDAAGLEIRVDGDTGAAGGQMECQYAAAAAPASVASLGSSQLSAPMASAGPAGPAGRGGGGGAAAGLVQTRWHRRWPADMSAAPGEG